MSPRSKSKGKSKDKCSAKSVKEQQKGSVKPCGSTNTSGGSPANAYNPLSGTFHTLEIPSGALPPPLNDSSHFSSIDDNDEHSSSPHGTVSEYDSVSNNGSCSGESEDPKEKIANSTRLENVPGLDNEKRGKIRLKNEKKHQRQKERRAQELHERCTGYLMSKKLEALSQQLVAMGFSAERATLALLLNEGRLEESVNWLFEANEEEVRSKESKLVGNSSLKIDITEELSQMSRMVVHFKCSKQEVERAVAASEGDLVKAEETLQAQKREVPVVPPVRQEIADAKNLKRVEEKPVVAASLTSQPRRNERDFNPVKTASALPSYAEPATSRHLQLLNQEKALADKRWVMAGPNPSFSTAVASPVQGIPLSAKLEIRRGIAGNEVNSSQQMIREPIAVMQHPQSVNPMQDPVPGISALHSVPGGWYSNDVTGDSIMPNVKLLQNTGNLNRVNQNSEQFYHSASYKGTQLLSSSPVDFTSELVGSWGMMRKSLVVPSDLHSSYGMPSTPSLAVPSSLGLFAGWGSGRTSGSSAHVDWNTGGLIPDLDYASVDWTLDSNLLPSKSSGLWLGLSSLLRNSSATRMSGTSGSCIPGLRDGGVTQETSQAGLREWTSPFTGKDMFSLPRRYVTSP
ncbi:hypothetical protein K2173_024572 [Erythroxylum novogranatense]|uniref:UBA domain-containing protein n=1 Tax=Erythroxylum novogranatense TaxID=1862640 RepID=A0AAV8SUR4_9ROSI|nr:hypothetical protein K2173_024572 [Erythroxylum novogranatense]